MYDNACIGNFSLIFFPKFFIAEEKQRWLSKVESVHAPLAGSGIPKKANSNKKSKKSSKKE